MFKKLQLLVIGVFLVSFGNAQNDLFHKKFGPNELKSDLEILVSDLKACHPGLYEYTTPEMFDSLANAFELGLTDSLTQEEFHVRIRKFIRVVGCGHTLASPSKEWYAELKGNVSAVPIHVFLQDDKLFIKKAFDEKLEGLVGSHIVSIDGVLASEVLSELRSIVGRDGVGETLVNRNVERLFQTYYLFLNGMKEEYLIEVETADGQVVTSLVKGKSPKKFKVQRKHELVDVIEASEFMLGFIDSTHRIAVMDINSFPPKGFKKFYRKSFEQLAEDGSETLIIDLRGNGGGYFPNGNQLLSHLMKQKFTMDFDRPKKQGKRSKYIKADFLGKVTRLIFATIPDRNKEDPDRNYQVTYKPVKKNQFNGQVYIITDGWTYSTASFVASKLKNSGNAIIVGDETGGGEVAFNAVLKWSLSLPNTAIRVTIPMYHVDVQPEMKDVGRGVVPIIPVKYESIEQRTQGVDFEMEVILDLLRSK